MRRPCSLLAVVLAIGMIPRVSLGSDDLRDQLEARFTSTIRPFLQTYCTGCHGKDKPEAEFDLSGYSSLAAVSRESRHLGLLVQRLKSAEMPPEDSKAHPSLESRREVIAWFEAVRADEAQRHAGDPGLVLARRLSNSEYNNSIRDLTGVDIRPTREFPVDPANTAGFDNSGESLTMSPALLKKYLGAAQEVANYLVLKPEGFAFAPHPMLVETDRDKYCVSRIIEFYHRQNLDYADYFLAAWRFKHRETLGKPGSTLDDLATKSHLSPKYLATVWSVLEGPVEEVGPLVKLQKLWKELPAPVGNQPELARNGCREMRDYVIQLRKKVEPRFWNLTAGKIGAVSQPLLIWKNRQYATHRMTFDPAQLQVEGRHPSLGAPPRNRG